MRQRPGPGCLPTTSTSASCASDTGGGVMTGVAAALTRKLAASAHAANKPFLPWLFVSVGSTRYRISSKIYPISGFSVGRAVGTSLYSPSTGESGARVRLVFRIPNEALCAPLRRGRPRCLASGFYRKKIRKWVDAVKQEVSHESSHCPIDV